MSTNSAIAVVHANGTVSEIYCHYDGHIIHNGRILNDHYATLELAESLVAGGDLSVLDERQSPIGEHSFDAPEKGTCIYYGRDRGVDGSDPIESANLAEFHKARYREEYCYLFVDGVWKLEVRSGKCGYQWDNLSDHLEEIIVA